MTVRVEDIANLESLPPRSRALHQWAAAQHPPQFSLDAARACVASLENLAQADPAPLGRRPLVVISTGNQSDGYSALQGQLLNLSHDSKQSLAGHSFHAIQIDQPEIVVRAIRDIVDAVRTGHALQR